jgi:hypothetical protein
MSSEKTARSTDLVVGTGSLYSDRSSSAVTRILLLPDALMSSDESGPILSSEPSGCQGRRWIEVVNRCGSRDRYKVMVMQGVVGL